MSIKNVLTWNPDPHPNLIGYDVTVNAGAATRVPSNVFVDPANYGNVATADAIVYSVTAVRDTTRGRTIDSTEAPDAVTLRVSRWPIDGANFPICVVSGSLRTIAGVVPIRPEIRASLFWSDVPFAVAGGYILGDDVSFYANSEGSFEIPMIQETRAFLHIPAAHIHGIVVVPASETANLVDLDIETVDILRND